MAEAAEEGLPKEGFINGAMVGNVLTMYLLGVYTLKRGKLSPWEAMDRVMAVGKTMEKGRGAMVSLKKKFGKSGADGDDEGESK